MLKWVIGSSLKYRFIVIAIGGGLMFFGVQQLRHAQLDVFPEFAPPRVEVQTPSLGLSVTEVESLVTIPLEQSLAGIPGLDELRSKSVEGLSSVLLIFEGGNGSTHGAPARKRTDRDSGAHATDVGESSLHDPAAVVDKPGDEDRTHVRRP